MGRSDDKLNDILAAAIGEFCEKGMMASTMEGIAGRACVSKRTLYRHYPCKENLLDAVVESLLQRIAPLKNIAYDPDRPLLEQLKKLGTLAVQLSNDPDYLRLSRIVIIESMRSEKEANRLNGKFVDCEQGLHNWFIQASKAGALGDMAPELAAALFYGPIRDLGYWDQAICWSPQLSSEESDAVVTKCCEFFIRGISSQAASGKD
ncbi:TetR/AcrR family transcriptional regulator [Aliiglaciecola sp. CAU 1673]|uniref:TetR/AcrR family transcriptional regulator n=1 Tax=Aliiglaciecola sp. CAU 1673 TaxID=3032595 RepID=UPI0023D9B88E|nr:TetR/AcrR family transcriptional regulator [Aliiglaciecola sp. CAU 1673]MDF2179056.1 TetR/AcrR family transcriptional regulator [Aliiglaciecola sp. CAU 1673]